MSIVSYAQNFEDVMLWRALGHVTAGFYIDVGAQHPVIDSVSKAFYERGWRGIHVEPATIYANLLRQDRPDETVLQAALTNTYGTLTFYEIPETGLSTADLSIAGRHKQQGFEVHEITVPCLALADVFERAGTRDIHWLKIDVEGFERQVLESWRSSPARPWIVVVESTLPLTPSDLQREFHAEWPPESRAHWEPHLLDYGYEPVYFDGLNRYYVSIAKSELCEAFRAGPNVIDGFQLDSAAPFCSLVRDKYQAELNRMQAEMDLAEHAAAQELERLAGSVATEQELCAKQQQALREQLQAAHDAIHQLEANLVEQSRTSIENEQSLLRDHTTRLESLFRQFQSSHTELRQVTEEGDARERALAQQTAEMRQEVEGLLRTLTQRESEFSQALMQARDQAEQALADQRGASQTELRRLTQEGIERERALIQQNLEVRQETENVLRSLAQREGEFARELLQVRREAERTTTEQARTYTEQQRALRCEQVEREQKLTDQIGQLQLEAKQLLHSLAQREREFADELRQAHREAEQTFSKQAQVHAEHEHELVRQLLAVQAELRSSEARSRDNESQLGREIASKQADLIQLMKAHAALEAQLKEQVARERHAALLLRASLDTIHTSFAWRITAPLRWIRSLFFAPTPEPRPQAPPVFSSAGTPIPTPACAAPATRSDLPPQNVSEHPTSALAINPPMNNSLAARTLNELLSRHDEDFILSSYQTLLGRQPDSKGLDYYLGRLRRGISKHQIVAQLAVSAECRARNVKLPGLDAVIHRYRLYKAPVIGPVIKLLAKDEGGALQRKLRSIENQICLLESRSNQHFNRMEHALAEIHHLVAQLASGMPRSHQIPDRPETERSKTLTIEALLEIAKGIS